MVRVSLKGAAFRDDRGHKKRPIPRNGGQRGGITGRALARPDNFVFPPPHETGGRYGFTQAIYIDQGVAVRVQNSLLAANRHGNHPCPC